MKKPVVSRKIPVQLSVLSDEDKASLRAEAKKSIVEEMAQDARDAYFASEVDKLRREQTPNERRVNIFIDAAPFVPFIMIDGEQFYHGGTYSVPNSQALVLFEQMQRSWQHQDEIDGRRKSEAYRRPQDRRLGPADAGSVTRGVNGAVVLEA